MDVLYFCAKATRLPRFEDQRNAFRPDQPLQLEKVVRFFEALQLGHVEKLQVGHHGQGVMTTYGLLER